MAYFTPERNETAHSDDVRNKQTSFLIRSLFVLLAIVLMGVYWRIRWDTYHAARISASIARTLAACPAEPTRAAYAVLHRGFSANGHRAIRPSKSSVVFSSGIPPELTVRVSWRPIPKGWKYIISVGDPVIASRLAYARRNAPSRISEARYARHAGYATLRQKVIVGYDE